MVINYAMFRDDSDLILRIFDRKFKKLSEASNEMLFHY